MAGISSKALSFGEPKNKEKTFQGQRFDDELGLNWVQFKWRNHDPQIGRFIEIDPLSEKYEYNSTYAFSENKVTTHVELEGLEAEYINDFFSRAYNEVLLPIARVLNQANPIAKGAEIVSGKSIESDFSQSKSRSSAVAELGMIFIAPEANLEKGLATAAIEKSMIKSEVKQSVVSLDNNALIGAIEKGEKGKVVDAIGSSKPIISITAAKEYLAKGSKSDLKLFMSETGATISKNGASASQVSNIQATARGLGRSVSSTDASIIGGAANNNATIITRDKQMTNFLKAIGSPVIKF